MAVASVTKQLAEYMEESRKLRLPPQVVEAAKHRILDTFGAIISGARLPPGQMAIQYVLSQGGTPEASVLATDIKTSAVNAALANGMFGHSDETDDLEQVTAAHPGCSVLPASLAMMERGGNSGEDLIRSVVLGYDLCCRFLMALGPDTVRECHRSPQGISATLGSAAAAASMAKLDQAGMRYVLSYAAQQISGIWSWRRDTEHVEKAFDIGGMGARNGVTAAIMVQLGFTGVWDVFDGEHNVLEALSPSPTPEEMVKDLGNRFFLTETAMKAYPVGGPIQAALGAFFALLRAHSLTADNVRHITVRLPEEGIGNVDNSAMPDLNCQHMLAVALVDGTVNFASTHSYERMSDPPVVAVKERVTLIGDNSLGEPETPRSASVEVILRDGRAVTHLMPQPLGSWQNPMTNQEVNLKARDLLEPVIGPVRTEAVIQGVNNLEGVGNIQELLPSLTLGPEDNLQK